MDIVTRAEWGARPPKDPPTPTVAREAFLHHTVGSGSSPAGYMRSMQRFHQDVRGWNDLAYNYVVDPKTLAVFEGRGGSIRPGAQKGHNTNTVAVAVMGNFVTEQPTERLLDTIADLTIWLHVQGHAPKYLTGGHRDAPGSEGTTCPGGNLYVRIPDINERIRMADDDLGPNGEPNWSRVQEQFKPSWTRAWLAKVLSESSDPKDTLSKEELMVFFDRAGLLGN